MNKLIRYLTKLSLAGVIAVILTVGPAFATHKGVVHGSGAGKQTLDTVGPCGTGQVAKWTGSIWECADDIDTDTDTLEGLTCAKGQVAKSNIVGNWSCQPDIDTLGNLGCAAGEVAKWNGSIWVCAADIDTDTDTLGGLTCAKGQVAKSDIVGNWSCQPDIDTDTSAADCPIGEILVSDGNGGTCVPYVGDPSFKVVFVTHLLFLGDMGGLAGADSICQDAADGAGLTGRFKAWLSASDVRSPAIRFVRPTPPDHYRLNDPTHTLLAWNWTTLTDGNIDAPIRYDEHGHYQASPYMVWTGTSTAGTYTLPNCLDWTAPVWETPPRLGGVGDLSQTTSAWTDTATAECDGGRRLYCFQQ